jgi:hypothetical protein
MSQVAELRFTAFRFLEQPGIWIRRRFVGLVLSLLSVKIDLSSRARGLPLPSLRRKLF